MKTNKSFWFLLLFAALIFFLLSLNSGNYFYNILAIGISFIVYRYGYESLFKEYDKQQQEKQQTVDRIYSALREGKKKGENK